MKNSALLIVDVQVGLVGAPRHAYRGAEVVARIKALMTAARESGTPVVFVQHDGDEDGPVPHGSPGWQIHPEISPAEGETVIRKHASDSFLGTTLRDELEALGARRLFVVGLNTQYCVDTTCRSAVSHGFDVTLVGDAHTTTDNGVLSASQIIEHHNLTLDDFGTDEHVVTVRGSSEISFA
ncbi:MAG: cysteine hydrolase [Acidobacteria bacterium]|nr:cysteine hydrolase [Acidobacteriota bacterium]